MLADLGAEVIKIESAERNLADHRSELFSCFRFLGVLRVFHCY
jgi:crotonobetainyl-CoA:carnitine CoA-transferase CaiB-like acyl-CoA transferase